MVSKNLKNLFIFSFCTLFAFFFYLTFDGGKVFFNGTLFSSKALAEKGKKVWISSSSLIAHGKKVYQTNCAVCHGLTGKGDGIAGKSLKPPPKSFVEGKWKQGGDSISLYKTITNGVKSTSMASFKHLPQKDRWALVHFIRSITQNKIPDNAKKLEAFAQKNK